MEKFILDVKLLNDEGLSAPVALPAVACRECCLSGDNLGEVTTRRNKEVGIMAKFLDMNAYSKNKKNLIWRIKTIDNLVGLGGQVLQHEFEHLQGNGIWCHRHMIGY